MNERIKELYDQCFVVLDHDTPNIGFDIEKFAELIVRECIGRIQLNSDMDEVTEKWVYDNLSGDIKEHFGVKE